MPKPGGQGRQVDDRATLTLLQHLPGGMFGDVIDTIQVHVDGMMPDRVVEIDDRRRSGLARHARHC